MTRGHPSPPVQSSTPGRTGLPARQGSFHAKGPEPTSRDPEAVGTCPAHCSTPGPLRRRDDKDPHRQLASGCSAYGVTFSGYRRTLESQWGCHERGRWASRRPRQVSEGEACLQEPACPPEAAQVLWAWWGYMALPPDPASVCPHRKPDTELLSLGFLASYGLLGAVLKAYFH